METGYVYNLCSNLGSLLPGKVGERQRFLKNDEKCLKSLKRLRREMNYDQREESNSTVVLLGDLMILKNYLIPLAIDYGSKDKKLLLELTKVVVQLTMPLGIADKASRQKRLGHLQTFKSAFLVDGALQAFVQLLDEPLERMGHGKREEDKLVVELVLWLIRNLLAIPDSTPSSSAASKNAHLAYLHENFLSVLSREYVIDVLVHLGEYVGSEGNREWNLILLEIFFQVFRGLHVEDLFDEPEPMKKPGGNSPLRGTRQRGSGTSALADAPDKLLRARAKRVRASKAISSRHPKFGGQLRISNVSLGVNKVVSNAFAMTGENQKCTSSLLQKEQPAKQQRRKQEVVEASMLAQEHILSNPKPLSVRSRRLRDLQRRLCDAFVDKCYKPIFEALKQDFRREDIRLLPSDQVQFLFLVGLCTGLERLRVATSSKNDCAWHESPVLVTMDMWTFHFVLKSCQIYVDEQKEKETEICAEALKQMVLVLWAMQKSEKEDVRKFCVTLRNSALYDITQFEVVPVMIRKWSESKNSWHHLASLAQCGDALLKIADAMAHEGVVVRSKSRKLNTVESRAHSEAKRKTGKPWGAEEVAALVEATKQYGRDMKGFRKSLRDASLGPIFDSSRTAEMLFFRWSQIESVLREKGCSIEHYLERLEDDGPGTLHEKDAEEVNEEQRKQELERVRAEKELVLEPLVRPYLATSTLKNLCLLIDPSKVPCDLPRFFVLEIQCHVFTSLLRHSLGSCVASLWHVSLFGVFGRALHEYRTCEDRADLVQVIRSIVSQFFEHAKDNHFAFVEVLYWRHKGENEFMLNRYEDAIDRQRRLQREQDRKDQEALARLRRETRTDSSSASEAISEIESGEETSPKVDGDGAKTESEASRRRLKKLRRRKRKDKPESAVAKEASDSEKEADLDEIGFSGIAKKSKRRKRTLSKWTREQCEVLVEKCEEYSSFSTSVYDMLKCEGALNEKSTEDIKNQVSRLRLACSGGTTSAHRPADLASPEIARYLRNVVGDEKLRGCAEWIQSRLEKSSRVLLPTEEEHFVWLRNQSVAKLLGLLGYQGHGSPYLRLAGKDLDQLRSGFMNLVEAARDRDDPSLARTAGDSNGSPRAEQDDSASESDYDEAFDKL